MAENDAPLTERAHAVLAHLLTDPYGDHAIATTATAVRLPYHQADSAFSLLVARGWMVRRDTGGIGKLFALTSTGRSGGKALVEACQVGTSLQEMDRIDPAAADRARAVMG